MASSNCHKHILRDFPVQKNNPISAGWNIFIRIYGSMALWHNFYKQQQKKSFCIKMGIIIYTKTTSIARLFCWRRKILHQSSPMAGVKSDALCFRSSGDSCRFLAEICHSLQRSGVDLGNFSSTIPVITNKHTHSCLLIVWRKHSL